MEKKHFKIGELANLVYISVRTLHHYDHIGLLVPSQYSDSGHRLYTKNDISRLQQILSLRNIGFTLEEIKEVLDGSALSPLEITNMHLRRVQDSFHKQKALLQRLEFLSEKFSSYKHVSLQDFFDTIEVIIMNEQKSMNVFSRAVPILDVVNYEESMKFYTETLGFRKNWEWGNPAGFGSVSRDQVEIFLNQEDDGNFGTSINVFVRDVEALYKEAKKNDAVIMVEPKMMQWGKELRVKDPDGHILRFTETASAEEKMIHRTEIKAKLENRLAALMEDLARETERSVGELLEEIIMHSFEPLEGLEGQASASPHTIETLELIDKLKKKHQIDYGTHDIYGFVEGND
ncbi:glyoxalase superfamily protein [Lederbergia wuyishanensis]|uniref:DNA-binding transcriptional MerR regulator/uncharacterized glyoxalase superfamily protein PhnB n=1 Tax=Lederbergia wuyishanensis TaxID=1347903 RepID=A0ABU0D7Z2_9BACI|nr:glyoxalase superfamily protein [Lederbergia wuyishanensis]MCJ8009145.1 glyoxalase superfamily protein [Lederbergia wuyishanensis]MDQ0344485.1 DNA-binding transcriptional MerR regulator/uncharacterized glyoxalase superfamily protein PhnB [Lederbergia wuyishanensis]